TVEEASPADLASSDGSRARASMHLVSGRPSSAAGGARGEAFSEAAGETRPEPSRRAVSPAISWSQDPALVEMRREIHELRGLLENQLAHLAWGDLQRREPHTTELLRRLSELGLASGLCRALAEQVGPLTDEDQAWRRALGLLAHQLPVTDDDILNSGGVIALVGSTGVGKTTSVAK